MRRNDAVYMDIRQHKWATVITDKLLQASRERCMIYELVAGCVYLADPPRMDEPSMNGLHGTGFVGHTLWRVVFVT
jgi:hypothetical protein